MRQESLKTKVYQTLRKEIITGQIPGGTRVTEVAVAQQLSVSRTPVREALQKLAQERLLIAIPKAGYMVEDLSDNDLQDLFSTRMAIEKIAAEKAVGHIALDEIKALDDNLEKTQAAVKAGDDLALTELDAEFHSIIYTAARSRSLFRICKMLNDMTVKYRHGITLTPALQTQMLQLHIDIYQALISKKSDLVQKAVENHGEKAKSHLMQVMQKVRSDSFKLEQF